MERAEDVIPTRTVSSTAATGERQRRSKIAAIYARWQPYILLGLYFLLLICNLIVPLVASWVQPWLESTEWPQRLVRIQTTGLNIAIVGMIGLLLKPFLQLVESASSSLDTVSNIQHTVSDMHDTVERFDFPAVSVRPGEAHTHLVDAVKMYDAPLVFLGLRDEALIRPC